MIQYRRPRPRPFYADGDDHEFVWGLELSHPDGLPLYWNLRVGWVSNPHNAFVVTYEQTNERQQWFYELLPPELNRGSPAYKQRGVPHRPVWVPLFRIINLYDEKDRPT